VLYKDALPLLNGCSRRMCLNDDVKSLSQCSMQMSQFPRQVHVSQGRYIDTNVVSWISMQCYESQCNVMDPNTSTQIVRQVNKSQGIDATLDAKCKAPTYIDESCLDIRVIRW
jgi:hypothetical protein